MRATKALNVSRAASRVSVWLIVFSNLMSAGVARYNGTPFYGWGMPTNKKLSDSETSLFWLFVAQHTFLTAQLSYRHS
jgi:hypothetical protein